MSDPAIIEAAAPECEHVWWDAGEHNPGHEQCSRCWKFRPSQSGRVIEAAAQALEKQASFHADEATQAAMIVLAAVTPLIEADYVRSRATIHVAAIRNAALEEAAKVADKFTCGLCGMDDSAAREIRALKEQP